MVVVLVFCLKGQLRSVKCLFAVFNYDIHDVILLCPSGCTKLM